METATEVSPSAQYEVPGEPGVYWCARHRRVKTRLRCGRCEKPICPQCTVMGPTGARCRDCASNRSSHIYKVGPLQFLATFAAMAVLSAIGAALIGVIGLFVIFFAPVAGTFLGKIVTSVTHGKRGTPLAVVASLGAAFGALAPRLGAALFLLYISSLSMRQYHQVGATAHGAHLPVSQLTPLMAMAPLMDPFLWIYLVLVIPAIWYWIK